MMLKRTLSRQKTETWLQRVANEYMDIDATLKPDAVTDHLCNNRS